MAFDSLEVSRLKRIVDKVRRKSKYSPADRKFLDTLWEYLNPDGFRAEVEHLKRKIQRAEAIGRHNEKLSKLYLTHTTGLHRLFEENVETGNFGLRKDNVLNEEWLSYLKADSLLYNQILEKFEGAVLADGFTMHEVGGRVLAVARLPDPISADEYSVLDGLRGFEFSEIPVSEDVHMSSLHLESRSSKSSTSSKELQRSTKRTENLLAMMQACSDFRDAYQNSVDAEALLAEGQAEEAKLAREIVQRLRKVEKETRVARLWHRSGEFRAFVSSIRNRLEEPEADRKALENKFMLTEGIGWDSECVDGYFAKKLERADALLRVAPNLASVYLAHTLPFAEKISSKEKVDGENYRLFLKRLQWYMEKDSAVYDQIVASIPHLTDEPRPTLPEVTKSKPVVLQPRNGAGNGSGRKEYHPPVKTYTARDLTGGQKLHHPTEDVKAAPECFAEDVLNNESAYSAKVRNGLARVIAQSKWYDRGLSDRQVLDFFGDMRVYAAQGKVPSRKEVGGLIEGE